MYNIVDMNKIKILPVTEERLIVTVAALAEAIWHEHYTPFIGASQVSYMLDKFQSRDAIAGQIKEGYLYFLIRDCMGTDVGYLAVLPRENELFLSKIYFTRNSRGRGYGRQTIEMVACMAKERNKKKVTLTVNKQNINSIQAYKKFGFTIAGPVVQDIGGGFVMDDYRMELTLQP